MPLHRCKSQSRRSHITVGRYKRRMHRRAAIAKRMLEEAMEKQEQFHENAMRAEQKRQEAEANASMELQRAEEEIRALACLREELRLEREKRAAPYTLFSSPNEHYPPDTWRDILITGAQRLGHSNNLGRNVKTALYQCIWRYGRATEEQLVHDPRVAHAVAAAQRPLSQLLHEMYVFDGVLEPVGCMWQCTRNMSVAG